MCSSVVGIRILSYLDVRDPQSVLTPAMEIILRASSHKCVLWSPHEHESCSTTAVSKLGVGFVFQCTYYKQAAFYMGPRQ